MFLVAAGGSTLTGPAAAEVVVEGPCQEAMLHEDLTEGEVAPPDGVQLETSSNCLLDPCPPILCRPCLGHQTYVKA